MVLLTTKLYRHSAQARSRVVARPRLIERLDEAVARPLLLISAPAGCGKTTLLSDWIAHTQRRVAWLSLDEGDNDPARFWTYCIAALQTVQADFGASAQAMLQEAGMHSVGMPQSLPLEAFLTELLNEMTAFLRSATSPDRFTLVLDDYHVITTPAIHAGLIFLLDHLPPQMQVIIATRADPPVPLARLRASNRMTEVRADDLRFTPDEAAVFLNHVMGLDLGADVIAALAARAEGWIVGLQLAALSLQERDEAATRGFVSAFTGSQRYILDYLVEEVLQRQPETTQAFLLQTSILSRLSGALCEAVTGRADGQSMLAALERANLFLIPLDEARGWYRYHQLFAEVLRLRLQQTQPNQVPELHRKAQLTSTQFLANGLTTLAWIRQAMGDSAAALEAMDEANHFMSNREVVALLNPVPAERARLLLARGDVKEATRWVKERGLGALDEPSYPREREYLLLARVLLALNAADQALGLLERLRALAETQERVESVIEARLLQALAHDAVGDHAHAVAALARSLTLAELEGYIRIFVDEGTPMVMLLRQAEARGVAPGYVGRLLAAFGKVAHSASATVPLLPKPLSERELEILRLVAAGLTSQEIAEVLVIAVVYSAAQFGAAPILGWLSDRHGRRPVLLLSVLGTSLTSLTYVLGPLWAGVSYDYVMPSAPYWTGALLLVLTWLLVARVKPVLRTKGDEHVRTS